MKKIKICDKEYSIDCNALTYVKYRKFFNSGILKDLEVLQNYLIKQSVVAKKLENSNLTDEEKLVKVSEFMRPDTDEFIIIITQIAWILIYTANNNTEEYETWLKSIKSFKIDDKWVVEVTEFAVACFC